MREGKEGEVMDTVYFRKVAAPLTPYRETGEYSYTDNASSFECFVRPVDQILNAVVAVWSNVDERYLLPVDCSRRN